MLDKVLASDKYCFTATVQGMTDNEEFFQTTCHNINSGIKGKKKTYRRLYVCV